MITVLAQSVVPGFARRFIENGLGESGIRIDGDRPMGCERCTMSARSGAC